VEVNGVKKLKNWKPTGLISAWSQGDAIMCLRELCCAVKQLKRIKKIEVCTDFKNVGEDVMTSIRHSSRESSKVEVKIL